MKRVFSLLVVIASAGLPAYAQKDENNRIENAGKVMVEILNVPDDIPQDLLDKAECVIVLPSVMKAAFVVGGSYGRGVLTCRSGPNFNGRWSAPAMMALEGGSVGFQIGGQATDFVLLVMNPTEYTPGRGYSTRTTVRKAVLLPLENASLTCLVAP